MPSSPAIASDVGDTEGTVTAVGLLSTKVRTKKGEEVILPNAVAIGGTIVNYSRYASQGELLLYTSITIGYDTPWRQVEALLCSAAERTAGLSNTPPPFVLQRALSDFYVEYQVNAVLEEPETRGAVLSALHANIQDASIAMHSNRLSNSAQRARRPISCL